MINDDAASIIHVSKIHEQRLLEALALISALFPMDVNKIQNLTQPQLFALEVVTGRFAKLQDLMGAKLFDLCLSSIGETTDGLTMIDKANKLEKFSVLDNAHWWMDMRKLRNNLTHEYPDQPEIAASILNKMYNTIPPMLNFYNKMVEKIQARG
jgi:uncharacterized protein with HEPN domain